MHLQDVAESLLVAARHSFPNHLFQPVGNAGQGGVDDENPVTGLNPFPDQGVNDLPPLDGGHTGTAELQDQPARPRKEYLRF